MIIAIRRYASMGLAVCAIAVLPQVVQAQIIPDGTLPTLVGSSNGLDFAIEDGGRSGNNLFHSFSQFSLPTGGTVIFNNAADVQNIFSRVTGGTVSNIDGLVQAQGSANLFLLNPSGIVFGPNAKLNIGGSFLGTTASRLKFADGMEFSAVNPAPLLTMSVPIDLQMGNSPASIVVQGRGNYITAQDTLFSPYQLLLSSNLQVNSGATLALVGGKIEMQGGHLNAGNIEISAIDSSSVVMPIIGLQPSSQGWTLTHDRVPQFGDIQLSQGSLLDANSGSIRIHGRNIGFQDASLAWVHNQSESPAGSINVTASGLLSLQGTTAQGRVRSGLESQSLGLGKGGNINVSAHDVTLTNGAGIIARSFGKGATGDVVVSATDHVQVKGFTVGSIANSAIANLTFGAGNIGNIQVTANRLTLLDAGNISNSTFNTGNAGKVAIDVMTDIEIGGGNPLTQSIATIGNSSFGSGDAGSLNINTARLSLRNSGRVSGGSFATGNGGMVAVNATEFVELAGQGTAIRSAIEILPPSLRAAFGLPPSPSGNAGNVIINTPLLRIGNQAQVSVKNQGSGNAGQLKIQADKIELTQQGVITASTAFGEGGNIELQSNELLLREGSMIATNASGKVGRGGDIKINSPIILGLSNSDIIANAVKGKGGNINITTQSIFGLKYRPNLTLENDITASSEFGVNGTVQVNTIGVNPNSGLTTLPVDIVDPSQKIATGCTNQTTSSFIATGRGGIPENPMQSLNGDRVWRDLRDTPIARTNNPAKLIAAIAPSQLVEATAWQINPQGQPELIDQGLESMSEGDRISCTK
jgi:filamentous hemagglutinin family protein